MKNRKTPVCVLIFFTALFLFSFSAFNQKSDNDDVKTGTNIGDCAPELKYTTPEGKEISLSSLRGKVVLIDFWASWCRPCRIENPEVVKAYNEYKDKLFRNGKGFTVFSVSLDNNKERWIAAIKNDGLEWEYHISDLMSWKSEPAALYGVGSIPSNFLIDADGIIIAKNLRGVNLHVMLESIVLKNEFREIGKKLTEADTKLEKLKSDENYGAYVKEIEKFEEKFNKLTEEMKVLEERYQKELETTVK